MIFGLKSTPKGTFYLAYESCLQVRLSSVSPDQVLHWNTLEDPSLLVLTASNRP